MLEETIAPVIEYLGSDLWLHGILIYDTDECVGAFLSAEAFAKVIQRAGAAPVWRESDRVYWYLEEEGAIRIERDTQYPVKLERWHFHWYCDSSLLF